MLKTFKKGGVHPAENKISAGSEIQVLPLPKQVFIPVSQHIGAPSTIQVKRGDMVKAGQLIAKSGGFVSANIHSSVSGKVVKIDQLVDASGYRSETIIIDVEGDDWVESIDKSEELVKTCNLSAREIIDKVADAGIVGLGGATFPSHVKLSLPPGKKAEYLILNGVECEPYLTADHALMLEWGEKMLVGTTILMKALGVAKCIIGIENNKPDAIEKLSRQAEKFEGIKVQGLKVKYPQGGEKQLIAALLNREVPSGGLPIDIGVVVMNVGSTVAVYEAVQKGKPLVDRVVTITGKSVQKPGNFLVRIGTPVSELIEAAGGIPEDTGKIINGGPMMGKALVNDDVPVTKGTSGILLMPSKEAGRYEQKECVRCSKCISACPMGLEPYLLMTLTERKMYDRAEQEKITDCMECGSCSYICPSYRHLLDYIRLGKGIVIKNMRSRKK